MSIRNDETFPYVAEAKKEAERLAGSATGEVFEKKFSNSLMGKSAELLLREGFVGEFEPISHTNISNIVTPFTEKLAEFSTKQQVFYHDLFHHESKKLVEVKRWAERNVENELKNFFNIQFLRYNFSSWLFVFAHDNKETWLEHSIDLEQYAEEHNL
ncbi:MAG: hypothetical protein QXN55_01335 [Candidatus Nitrosotenuis sp.]